jgi:inner membrane protein
MNPITHMLVGWTALEQAQRADRDRALVVLAGLAPDLDGLGVVVEFFARLLGFGETNFYLDHHRVWGHGLPAALVFSAVVAIFAASRVRAALCAFVAVHLHYLCDLLGSRGPGVEDIWGIAYFSPLADAPYVEWSGQWELIGWQNTLITLALLAWIVWRGIRAGYTPLRLASGKADAQVVAALRQRFGRGSS